ncbi:hypothetical protein AMTR_s00030p00229680 [Amborella trichopoda]|uniref:Uncharacterized protein n=1 Tax=Amborella trichopoda TaxID=13333 RepID=U5D167_AMBTC|nr:hypothetical protein AMTR_s00030p00229680 [Amborella trichopoda]
MELGLAGPYRPSPALSPEWATGPCPALSPDWATDKAGMHWATTPELRRDAQGPDLGALSRLGVARAWAGAGPRLPIAILLVAKEQPWATLGVPLTQENDKDNLIDD